MEKNLKKIKAINDRIFLTKDVIEKTGSILLPFNGKDGYNAPPYTGTIISVGPDVKDTDYQVGTRILFHDLAGFTIELGNEKVYSIREQDVVAIVEKSSEIIWNNLLLWIYNNKGIKNIETFFKNGINTGKLIGNSRQVKRLRHVLIQN